VFSTLAVTEALGGLVIKAPNGSTASSASPETLATYEMVFQTQGTYTAYYRVRGFNGSTDSFFAPDTFGVNPDNNQSTNQTGEFFWKKDTQTFTITSPNVGVPLEFRLGMREQQAEIDALVLNLSSSLTSAELGGLFAVLPGDFNGDAVVDAADYVVWRKTFGSTVPQWSGADGNGDTYVDEDDYQVWSKNLGSSLSGTGGNAATTVPEPAAAVMTLIALAVIQTSFQRDRVLHGSVTRIAERHRT
jgi:hypothetical protein